MHQFAAAAGESGRRPPRPTAHGRPRHPLPRTFFRLAAVALFGALAPAAGAQERDPRDLRVQGFSATGPRSSVTESAGTLEVIVSNPDETGKQARVVAFYSAQPEVRFARDVWVPARSIITTWMPIGPAPPADATVGREIEMLLYDRTGGTERLILPPGERKDRTRVIFYKKREPTTAMMLDWVTDPATDVRTEVHEDAVLTFIRLVRQANGLSDHVSHVPVGRLPPTAETLAGIDVLVLAGNRLRDDPPGRAAVRRWVQQGGTLWVMLDLVDPEAVVPLLGDDAPLGIVDRLGLTAIRMHRATEPPPREAREVERPIDLVRVIPAAADQVQYVANGWPAMFTRRLGRGKVVFTTLGDRGWWDDPKALRSNRTPPPPKGNQPPPSDAPIPLDPVTDLASELHAVPIPDPLTPALLQPLLTEDIGYTIIGRGTAAAILGGFVVVLLGLGVGLRRSRRPELVGWLVPGLAVLAAGGLVLLGERSRRTIPPTVGVVALVDPIPGTGEATMNGLYAVFQPSSGTATVGSHQGATLDLDAEGLGGQFRHRVQRDTDVWAWEGLSLPAGVRTGPFQATVKTGRITAVARFGPAGIEGRLAAGAFTNPADALLLPPARETFGREAPVREPLPARFGPDGTFTAAGTDALPPGNYIGGAVLDDRQQRRQTVYRHLFAGPMPRHLEGRVMLFAWATMTELPFPAPEGARVLGNALLAVPVEFERPAPGSRVTVPRGFLVVRRELANERTMPMTTNSTESIDMRLRFQLPPSVLPLQVERATIYARVQAPSRKFSLAGVADGKPVPLFEGSGTLDAVRIEINDPRLLQPDDRGGLYLNVALGESTDRANSLKWNIESLSVEVVGTTGEPK